MIDMRHPQWELAERRPRAEIHTALATILAQRDRNGSCSPGHRCPQPHGTARRRRPGHSGRRYLPLGRMVSRLPTSNAPSPRATKNSAAVGAKTWSCRSTVAWRTKNCACPATPERPAAIAACYAAPSPRGCSPPAVESYVSMGAVKTIAFEMLSVDTMLQDKAVALRRRTASRRPGTSSGHYTLPRPTASAKSRKRATPGSPANSV